MCSRRWIRAQSTSGSASTSSRASVAIIQAKAGEHHVIGYGGHVHQPAQAFVAGEFTYRGTLVGQYSELQELVALVDRGDVDLHTSRYDLRDVNEVAERLENREVDGRAVITP